MAHVYTTMERVVEELSITPGEWRRALDLQMVQGSNAGIRASIQSISNALRHAHQCGMIERRPVGDRTSEWRVR